MNFKKDEIRPSIKVALLFCAPQILLLSSLGACGGNCGIPDKLISKPIYPAGGDVVLAGPITFQWSPDKITEDYQNGQYVDITIESIAGNFYYEDTVYYYLTTVELVPGDYRWQIKIIEGDCLEETLRNPVSFSVSEDID